MMINHQIVGYNMFRQIHVVTTMNPKEKSWHHGDPLASLKALDVWNHPIVGEPYGTHMELISIPSTSSI